MSAIDSFIKSYTKNPQRYEEYLVVQLAEAVKHDIEEHERIKHNVKP